MNTNLSEKIQEQITDMNDMLDDMEKLGINVNENRISREAVLYMDTVSHDIRKYKSDTSKEIVSNVLEGCIRDLMSIITESIFNNGIKVRKESFHSRQVYQFISRVSETASRTSNTNPC